METEAQRQEIFDTVCTMESFSKHMSHPKLQNWFAWNRCSYDQQGEFWGTKLVFESQLDTDTTKLDSAGEKFSIKPSTDARAELQQLLKSAGGVELAYRLMKDGLQQHIKMQYWSEQAGLTQITRNLARGFL